MLFIPLVVKKIMISTAFLLGFSIFGIGQVSWIREFIGEGYLSAHRLSIDPLDNIYLVGGFSDDFKIGNDNYTGGGAFLAKFDTDNTLIWHKIFTSNSNQIGISHVETDGLGNIYITGGFTSSLNIEGQTLNGSNSNSFIAKYNSNGNLMWVKTLVGLQFILDISVNVSGSILIYSQYSRGTPVPATPNAFSALYSTDGTLIWSKTFGGQNLSFPVSAFLDDSGNSYYSGYFSSSLTIDSKNINLIGNRDLFVAKFNPAGECLLLKNYKRIIDPIYEDFSIVEYGRITADESGDIYIAGTYWSEIILGEHVFNGNSIFGGTFVSKINSAGDVVWAQGVDDYSTVSNLIFTNEKLYLSGTIGKEGYFSIHDPQLESPISPIYYPFEFVDNAISGLGLDSKGSIYACGRLIDLIKYSGFFIKFQIEIGIEKASLTDFPNSFCFPGKEIELHASPLLNATHYEWEITYLNKTTIVTSEIALYKLSPLELSLGGDFSVRVRGKNKFGTGPFSDYREIKYNIVEASNIKVPNIITPNNDSFNQNFVLDEALENPSISIFNRWGKEVYQNMSYDNKWSGEGLTSGTYYYTIQSKCLAEPMLGWVTISR